MADRHVSDPVVRQSLRARVLERGPLFGIYVNYPSPALVELAGHIGYDWVFIDAEHGPLDLEMCENMVRAAETAGIVPIIRLPFPDPRLANRYLDTGAMGLMVPHVASAEIAHSFVDAAKYHPIGRRGAGNRTRAARFGYGLPATEYSAWANAETALIGVLEDEAVLGSLPDILAVDGFDGFVVGPSDLSQSLGLPGQITHPRVVEAVERISRQVLDSGRLLVRNLMDPGTAVEDARRLTELGVPMIAEPFSNFFARAGRPILSIRDDARARARDGRVASVLERSLS